MKRRLDTQNQQSSMHSLRQRSFPDSIEFKILLYLFEHQGSVVSSETLFEAVWKEKYLDNNNTVMAHIARLREKLHEEPRKPKLIKTVWGSAISLKIEIL